MSWISIARLSELTGSSFRTIKKRCVDLETRKGPNNSCLLDSKQALPLIYKLNDDDKPDPAKENALLSRERRLKTQVELRAMERQLVPAEEVVNFCYDMGAAIRNKILSIAPGLRNRYPHIDAEMLDDLDEGCREALAELADDGIPNPLRAKMAVYLSNRFHRQHPL